MRLSGIRRSALAGLAALLVGVGAVVSAAPAHADRNAEFLERLDLEGVPYSSPTEVIRAAKEYCLKSTRPSSNKYRAADRMANDMGWSGTEAQDFGRAADRVFCPGNL